MNRVRVAVLASGGGSNLQALLDHGALLGDERADELVLVASDRPHAAALDRARAAGITTTLVASSKHPDGGDLGALLDEHRVELVVLAGYLRLVPAAVTRRFALRMINVHPALLPAFGGPGMYGDHVHRAVLAAGAALSGPTVHYVDDVYDHGAVIAQWPVPVLPADDVRSLAARVLRAEHLLFPRVVQRVAASVRRDGPLSLPVRVAAVLPPFHPELDDASLSRQLDAAFHALR